MIKWLILIIITAACLSLTTPANADSGIITGYVKDAQSGEPLPKATIVMVADKTTLKANLSTQTDQEGRYTIGNIPTGVYTLRATFIGYTPIEKSVVISTGTTAQIDILLEKQTSVLREVSVSAPVGAEQVRQSPFAVTVIEGSKFIGRGLTLDDAISRVTGVQVRRSGGIGSASRFNIRGLEGQRVQIYIDGNAADVAGNALTLDDIPMQLVERIEVYKGIIPAQFGGDGLGAAINIVTRHLEKGYLDAAVTVGSFGQKQLAFTGQRPAGPVRIGATVNIDHATNNYRMENPFRPGLRVERDHDAFSRLVTGIEVSTDRLGFDHVKLEGVLIASQQQVQGVQSNIQHAFLQSRFSSVLLEAEDKGARNGRLDTRLAVIVAHINGGLTDTSGIRYTWEKTTYASPGGRGEIGFLPANSENKTLFARQRSAITFRPGSLKHNEYVHTLSFTNVIDYTRYRPNDSLANAYAGRNVSNFPGNQTSVVLGFSHEWHPNGDRLINYIGVRGYYLQSRGTPSNLLNPSTTLPPEVRNQVVDAGVSEAIRFKVMPTLLVKASVELARRLPTSTELFGDGLLVFASPALRAERSLNLSTGFQFTHQMTDNRELRVEATGFHMKVTDIIRLGGGAAGAAYTNVGRANISGIEVDVQMDVLPWLFAKSYLTWQNVRDALRYEPGTRAISPTFGLRIPNIPYLFGGATVDLHQDALFVKQGKSRLFYEALFTEQYFYAYQISRVQDRTIPRTLTHTIGIEQSWVESGISVSAEIQNLTNERVLNILNNPLPGRFLRAKLRYTWMDKRERKQVHP